jgi:hypothetical protein
MWKHLVAEVGRSKYRRGWVQGCTISLIDCGASGAYAPGPEKEKEKEEEKRKLSLYIQ